MKRTPLKRKTPLRANQPWKPWEKACLCGKPPHSELCSVKPTKRTTVSDKERRGWRTLGVNPRKPMKKAGKKTNEWVKIRTEELKPAFLAAGITTCELEMNRDCWRNNALGFAHSLKRRHANTPALMREVCLACQHCHSIIEIMPEAEMAAVVRKVIASRKRQPVTPK